MKIPKNQKLWMTLCDTKGNPRYLITSDLARLKYSLYLCEGDKLEKVKVGDTPAAFEDVIGNHL